MLMWSWGIVSPQTVQKLMALLLRDIQSAVDGNLDMTMVDALAGLGSSGTYPQNMHRSLMHSIGNHKLPTPHSFLAPFRHTVLGYFKRSADMILPHELFAAIYHCYKQVWVHRICPSGERLAEFWDAVKDGAQFASHPVRLRKKFQQYCIPLSIHGDGTPVVGIGKAWGKLMDIWSWQSLLVAGPTILRTMLIFCVHTAIQSVKRGHNTLEVMFKKMAWSFNVLWDGDEPENMIGMTIPFLMRRKVHMC